MSCLAASFTVSNVSDSGAGSLRNAMLDANANPGLDTIHFGISGGGVHTIKPSSPLPSLLDPTVIDGGTQPGYVGRPLIEINGASAGENSGFRILAGNSVIRGMAINRFSQNGIHIEGPGTNLVQANYIGTDALGAAPRGNAQEGIMIYNSWGNRVGGTNFGNGNLVSGNGDAGVYLLNGGANFIEGNRIGTTLPGTNNLGNGNSGITIYNSAGNVIGGEATNARNTLSGNKGSGVYVFGGGSKSNYIQGNFIGVDVTGKVRVKNLGDGITVFNAPANFIGGHLSGQGNLLSGNGLAGLYLNGAGASNNVIQGNLCGTDHSGTLALGNGLAGIAVHRASGSLVGGTNPPAANVISGNEESGVLLSTNSSNNRILGNRIGVDISGAQSLGNKMNGISVQSAFGNIIAANVISGNAVYGCELSLGSSGNLLEGNFIGTDATGQLAIGNSSSGVRVDSPFNTIGGAGADGGNVVSGNLRHGIFLVGPAAQSNLVQGNFIGLDSSGTKPLKNTSAGVAISGAPRNVIGTVARGNCISGNSDAGIYLFGAGASGNRIVGNRIGTAASGKASVGNYYEGIYSLGASSNIFGGQKEGNLISGNRTRGMFFTNSSWNTIRGNVIGASDDNSGALPNGFHQVEFEIACNNNTVGGSSADANLIAFSPAPYAGVRIRDGSINNGITCNSIFGNAGLGIDIGDVGAETQDPCDADSGANSLQNSPGLLSVVASQGAAIRGTLNSRQEIDYVVQFYVSPSCPPAGQGQVYLGQVSVHTDPQCQADFAVTLPGVIPIGYFVTATATDPANNTSEFSPCLAAISVPTLAISATPDQQLQLTWPWSAMSFALKSTGSLYPPVVWQPVAAQPLLTYGQYLVTLPWAATNQFYALSFE